VKYLLLFALLFSGNVPGSEVFEKITKSAAKHGHCTIQNPCMITVHNQENGYSVLVRRSVMITDYGVLKFTTSALWIGFDKDGKFTKATPTP